MFGVCGPTNSQEGSDLVLDDGSGRSHALEQVTQPPHLAVALYAEGCTVHLTYATSNQVAPRVLLDRGGLSKDAAPTSSITNLPQLSRVRLAIHPPSCGFANLAGFVVEDGVPTDLDGALHYQPHCHANAELPRTHYQPDEAFETSYVDLEGLLFLDGNPSLDGHLDHLGFMLVEFAFAFLQVVVNPALNLDATGHGFLVVDAQTELLELLLDSDEAQVELMQVFHHFLPAPCLLEFQRIPVLPIHALGELALNDGHAW